MRALIFLAALFLAGSAWAETPAVSDATGDIPFVIACDTAEQVDSIIAAWQISEAAANDTYDALAQPGTGVHATEPACIANRIASVAIVSVEERGTVSVNGADHAVWLVGVERIYRGVSLQFWLLWSDATAIRYGPGV